MTAHAGEPRAALVIGLGNPLRTDDGVGPWLAAALAALGCPDLEVRSLAAPTPELIDDWAGRDRVVFIDAALDVAPGELRIRRLEARPPFLPMLGHAVQPEALVGLARALGRPLPDVWSVEVGVDDVGPHAGLSPQLEATLPGLLERLKTWLGVG